MEGMIRIIAVVISAVGIALILAAAGLWLAGLATAGIGQVWYSVEPVSLQLLQPAIERHVHPDLFLAVVLPILETPLAPVCLVAGAVLWGLSWLGLGRRRRRRWR